MTEQEARILLAEECRKQGLGGIRSLDRRAIMIFDKATNAGIAAILHVANAAHPTDAPAPVTDEMLRAGLNGFNERPHSRLDVRVRLAIEAALADNGR